MIYDLNIHEQVIEASDYFDKLLASRCKIELKRIPEKRTLKQNSYLHAILTIYGGEVGLSTEEAKTSVKRILGYTYKKSGQWFLRHTSDMDTTELTEFIDRLRNHSARNGIYLPTPDEFSENYVEMMRQVAKIESEMKRYS